jgi:Flp pilus assembly protein TadD
MSVLNDMLRDLHQRDAVPAEVSDGLMAGIVDVTDFEVPRRGRLRLGSALLLMLGMGAVWAGYGVAPRLTGGEAFDSPVRPVAAVPPQPGPVAGTIAPAETAPAPTLAGPALSLRLMDAMPSWAAGEVDRPFPVPAAGMEPEPEASSAPQASAVQVHQTPQGASGRISLDRPADYRVFTLRRPDRVVVDLFGVEARSAEGRVDGEGVVSRVHLFRDREDGLRVALDLSGPVRIRDSRIRRDGDRASLEFQLVPLGEVVPAKLVSSPVRGTEVAPKTREAALGAGSAATSTGVAGEAAAPTGGMAKRPVSLSPADMAESHYRKALHLARSGRSAAAQAQLRAALEADGNHSQARELLAVSYLDQRRFAEAESVIAEGLMREPTAPRLARLYARLWLEQGDPQRALEYLGSDMPPLANDPEYHAWRAVLLQKAGRHAEAAEVYGGLVRLRPEAGVWWMGLAISLEASDQSEEAANAYRQAAGKPDMTPALIRFVNSRLAALNAPHA